MVASTKGLGPEKVCPGKGQQHMEKTDPSSCQKGHPTKNKTIFINVRQLLSYSNKYLVMSPRWGSTPRLTD
jgi:hypothetical protein